MANCFLVGQGRQAGLCALNNIALTCTSDSLVRNIVFFVFFLKLLNRVLLRFTAFDSLLELKGSILCLKPPGNTFLRQLVKQADFEVLTKKNQVFARWGQFFCGLNLNRSNFFRPPELPQKGTNTLSIFK